MNTGLEEFISRIHNFDQLKKSEVLAYFGYFLAVIMGDEVLTPKKLRVCFEDAGLEVPDVSVMLQRSPDFVYHRNSGWRLHRNAKQAIESSVAEPGSSERVAANDTREQTPSASAVHRPRKVMVIHGRDKKVRNELFNFLRALHLAPIEWEDAVNATGKTSPYVGEILDAAFSLAQAIVVLFTPDEQVSLARKLCSNDTEYAKESGFQSRPNVFIEAGMALGRCEQRTILVEVGKNRQASDLTGRHTIRLDNSPSSKNALTERLRAAGCDVHTGGSDWLSGKFMVTKK